MMDDHGLLREYVRKRSQEAFQELVDRHLGMVYSAACRLVRDAHLAEEVVQNVFSTLAQKAGSIGPPQVVSGWLYNTTRHLAMHAVRTEQRRREREQTAVAMQSLEENADPGRIADHLESAMADLEASDRDVLVLRYLENHSLRQVGEELGITEDAARMRVNRGLERLRTAFGKQGVAVSSVLLATFLASGVATAVPAGLGAAVATAALAGTVATTMTQGAIMTMNWFNMKTAVSILSAAALTGTGTYFVQQREIEELRGEHQSLVTQHQKADADQEAALMASRLRDGDLERLRQDAAEVHRLRNEVAQARRQSQEAAAENAKLRQQAEANSALRAENQALRQQVARPPHLPTPQPGSFAMDPELMKRYGLIPPKDACIANLRQIEGAKEQWALENRKIEGTATAGFEAKINAFLRGGNAPACPGGGAYTYGPIGSAPACTLGASAGHQL